MRPGLPSLPAILDAHGYQTAAFVANWTLKDKLSGLGAHFEDYREVFTRKRWLGLMSDEATARDVNAEALAWLEPRAGRRRPFFVWVHYVEPHAPYRFHPEYAERLGIEKKGEAGRSDRYDTEIAFVDEAAGELLAWIDARPEVARRTLIVFTADHGESLGEHDYWGHGRNLYEPGLRVPLALAWPGRLRPAAIDAPATLLDVAPTVLGLAGVEVTSGLRGFDWSPVLAGGAPPPAGRVTRYQAHKGAVLSAQEARQARRGGLLEVGILDGGRKEVLRIQNGREHRLHDLAADPAETRNLAAGNDEPSEPLGAWRDAVEHGLATAPDLPPVEIDEESAKKLRALGYTG
jgi:arylsulfatase A-like enzyme